jgi:hypothetical protein
MAGLPNRIPRCGNRGKTYFSAIVCAYPHRASQTDAAIAKKSEYPPELRRALWRGTSSVPISGQRHITE